jgi:hypothetical protein
MTRKPYESYFVRCSICGGVDPTCERCFGTGNEFFYRSRSVRVREWWQALDYRWRLFWAFLFTCGAVLVAVGFVFWMSGVHF